MRPPQGNENLDKSCHPFALDQENNSQSFGRLPNQSDRNLTEPIKVSDPRLTSKLRGRVLHECGPAGQLDELTGDDGILVPVALHVGGDGGGLDGEGGKRGGGGASGVILRGPQSMQSEPYVQTKYELPAPPSSAQKQTYKSAAL